MTRLHIGLISREGNQLGHLVRGVQMLRSYGKECEVDTYSDVVAAPLSAGEGAALCCLLTAQSDATEERIAAMCRETEWALGATDQNPTLEVWIVRQNDRDNDPVPGPLKALRDGEVQAGLSTLTAAPVFMSICDWGQALSDEDTDVIGEWPDAVAGES